jgi:PHS family inorganic phosphate transporter-like MFS transporter
VSFYGINIFTPVILKNTFTSESLGDLCWQSVAVTAVGVPACMFAIYCYRSIGGRMLNFLGFILNAAAFAAMGVVYYLYPDPDASQKGAPPTQPWLKFALLCVLTFSLNWGPNVATYVCPVQVFPKPVRGTFHGLSAASGKLGAAFGAFIFPLMTSAIGKQGAADVFFLQVGVNILGALISWHFLPARGASGAGAGDDRAALYKKLNQGVN